MNWPAIDLRWKANEVIASDRRSRGDLVGAGELEDWNRSFIRCCEIFCKKPAGSFAGRQP